MAIFGCAWAASPRHAELEGRDLPNDQGREREDPKDRDAESDDDFDFGSAEEAEVGSMEESESGHKGSSRKKEPMPIKLGRDDAIKGEKNEDELETVNSDESENRSNEAESVQMFNLDTLYQRRTKRKRSVKDLVRKQV